MGALLNINLEEENRVLSKGFYEASFDNISVN